MQQAVGNAAVKAIVLICDGRTFIAGADITEFGKPPQGAEPASTCSDTIENSPEAGVAAIHGTALGGGLEVALVLPTTASPCRRAKCGLPEVNLGLLPGAGGTQRLPRIVGVAKALEMMTSGAARRRPRRALAMGLVDEIVDGGQAARRRHRLRPEGRRRGRPLRKVRDINDKVEAATRHAGALRRVPQGQRAQVPRLHGARGQHPAASRRR